MDMTRDWFARQWLGVTSIGLAVICGYAASLAGANGFALLFGGLLMIGVFITGFRRPAITPYFIITFVVFDRDLHLSSSTPVSTLTILLLFLMPGFLSVIIKNKVLPRFAWLGGGILSVGLAVASMIASEPGLAWWGVLKWIPVLVMVGAVATLCATEPALTSRLATAVVIGGGVAGVFGMLQRNGHYWLVGPPYASDVTDSTFGYYTNFANFEAVAGVLGVGIVYGRLRIHRRPSVVVAAATLLCLFMVVTSYSRGAVVLVCTGLFIVLIREFRRPRNFVPALAVTAIIGWLVFELVPADYLTEIFAKFTHSQGGDVVRSQLQAGGFDLLRLNPLGIGFNNFSAYVASGDVYSTLALAHAHNTFIQMGLDAGWLGAAGFLILALGSFWISFRSVHRPVQLALGAALAGYLVQVSQDYFFFEQASLVLFGLLIGGALGDPAQGELVQGNSGPLLPRPYRASNAET